MATYTGTGVLEFGFKAKNTNHEWHLDDVSVVNRNASNAQMITNGNFENGTLTGWQVLCTTTNGCSGAGGILSTSSCHGGSHCYSGECYGAYDFLRQTFSVTLGNVYTLTFWIFTDGHPQQEAFVRMG